MMKMATNEKMVTDESMNLFPVMDCYDYLDFLKEEQDIADAFMNDKLYIDMINGPQTNVNDISNQNELVNLPKFDNLDNFNEQCLSASDTSLADQNSPQNLYSPELVSFGSQHSPSSGSTDSGIITNSNPSSPILSPDASDGTDRDLLSNFGNLLDTVNVNGNDETTVQNQLLMKYLIQQQVQQALIQQQSKEKLQQLQQEAQLKQQLLLLAQQQQLLQASNNQNNNNQNNLNNNLNQTPKNDSQLRKMLQQTKHNIINSLHGKKSKNISFKFKSNNNNKTNKRKMTGIQNDGKAEKLLALSLSEDLPIASSGNELDPFDVSDHSEPNYSTAELKQPMLTEVTSQSINLASYCQPAVGVTTSTNSSENMFIPQATARTTTYIPASIPTSTNLKVPITRLKPSTPTLPPVVKFEEPKKTRVEHVVIEKRYRMKITDSLNELKCMLSLEDDKKPTKNSILQAAINEIKRLKQENDALTKKYNKMKKIFDELRKVGILASGQVVTSSSSESNISDVSVPENKDEVTENVDPLVKQDHFASPFQRQSARDGAKMVTCFGLFMFLCINPLNYITSSNTVAEDGAYNSRHLMSVTDQESSSQFSLASNVINIILSLFILILMVIRGNPKCAKNPTITQCFRSQMSKAQKKIDRHEYEEAKAFIRIALFVIGNSCPKTLYGQLASFLWKCICHILYQLGVLRSLQSLGYAIFPSTVSSASDREDQEYTARYSAEAYRKLHEIALKDNSSTYLEAACYLMNGMYAAEIAGDHELLCTAYATAVVHMQEKLWFSYFLQYYFTGCAHHASLASNEGSSFKIDWIFESRGYEYFISGLWDIRNKSAFHVYREDSELHEDDLLENIYSQFQEYLFMKSIRRMVVPERYYPNEGKIELRQRAKSFLANLGTGPVSEHLDVVAIYHQSLYGWWGSVLSQLIDVMKNGSLDVDQVRIGEDLFEEIDENHRHDIVVMAKAVFSSYIAVRDLKKKYDKLSDNEMAKVCCKVQDMLLNASRLIEEQRGLAKYDETVEEATSSKDEISQLIYIMSCDLVVEASFMLWQMGRYPRKTEQELDYLLNQNEVLQLFSSKYPELAVKAQQHDYQIQCISGNNQADLHHLMKRAKHIQTAHHRKDSLNGIYSKCNHYPLKQDGFIRCR